MSFSNKKIKIAHITFDMSIGGAEQVICSLTEYTDKTKYDVSILCLQKPVGSFGKQLADKGYNIVSFNRKPGFDVSLIKEIRNYINKNKINLLHCHQYTPFVYGLFGSLFTPARIIFTEHGRFYPDTLKIKRFLLNPVLNLFTDHITVISSATKNALVKFEHFPSNKIKVIYNGINDSKYSTIKNYDLKEKIRINEKAFVLGTVARLDPIKNQKIMIESLKILCQNYPNLILLIVGDGPERKNLEAATENLGLSDSVIFTGYREDVHHLYNVMDIFLLTSFSEGTAITLLEAMASGLPCIVTNVGGNPEIVEDKITGLIIPDNDGKALIQMITIMLNDINLRQSMSIAARKRYDEFFKVEKMINSYQALYEESVQ